MFIQIKTRELNLTKKRANENMTLAKMKLYEMFDVLEPIVINTENITTIKHTGPDDDTLRLHTISFSNNPNEGIKIDQREYENLMKKLISK